MRYLLLTLGLNIGIFYNVVGNTSPYLNLYCYENMGHSFGKMFDNDLRTNNDLFETKEAFQLKPSKNDSLQFRNVLSGKISLVNPIISVSYERILIPYLGLEVNAGLFGFGLGTNFYYPALKPKSLRLKAGILYAVGTDIWYGMTSESYFSMGINYLSRKGFVITADGGISFDYVGQKSWPSFSIRIGKAF